MQLLFILYVVKLFDVFHEIEWNRLVRKIVSQ